VLGAGAVFAITLTLKSSVIQAIFLSQTCIIKEVVPTVFMTLAAELRVLVAAVKVENGVVAVVIV